MFHCSKLTPGLRRAQISEGEKSRCSALEWAPKIGVPDGGAWRRGALGEGQLITTHPGSALAALKGKHKKFSGGFEGLGPGVTPGCLGVSSSASSSPCATTAGHLAAPRALRGPQL